MISDQTNLVLPSKRSCPLKDCLEAHQSLNEDNSLCLGSLWMCSFVTSSEINIDIQLRFVYFSFPIQTWMPIAMKDCWKNGMLTEAWIGLQDNFFVCWGWLLAFVFAINILTHCVDFFEKPTKDKMSLIYYSLFIYYLSGFYPSFTLTSKNVINGNLCRLEKVGKAFLDLWWF